MFANDFKSMRSPNQSAISPLPRRSCKINIRDYGYDDATLKQARNSVDRLMGAGKSIKDLNMDEWAARQDIKQKESEAHWRQITMQNQKLGQGIDGDGSDHQGMLAEEAQDEREFDLERSLQWGGLVTMNQSSQLPVVESRADDAPALAQQEAPGQDEDGAEAAARARKSTQSQRSNSSRGNIFAKNKRNTSRLSADGDPQHQPSDQ